MHLIVNLCNRRLFSTCMPVYKAFIDWTKIPKINPDELEEKFTKGWGPGGQAVNKTTNAVFLKHIPTGIWVKCHDTRSLDQNRKIAKQRLVNKLDNFLNGELSIENQKKRIEKEKHDRKKEKTRLKYEERRREKLIAYNGELIKDECEFNICSENDVISPLVANNDQTPSQTPCTIGSNDDHCTYDDAQTKH